MIRRVINEHTAYYGHLFHAQNIFNAEENKGRSIEIYESSQFKRLMMLDRTLVTSERDAFAYYEMLVHVILYAHPNPKRVLLIGNARKLLYQQILKHSDLLQVDHILLDESIARHYDEWFKTDPNVSCFIKRLEMSYAGTTIASSYLIYREIILLRVVMMCYDVSYRLYDLMDCGT